MMLTMMMAMLAADDDDGTSIYSKSSSQTLNIYLLRFHSTAVMVDLAVTKDSVPRA